MRLIDADELKVYIDDCQCCYKCPKKQRDCSDTCPLPNFLNEDWLRVIDEQPTIDPVKHGHWIKTTYLGNRVIRCSRCGYNREVASIILDAPDDMINRLFKACDLCGAKMDEVSECADV